MTGAAEAPPPRKAARIARTTCYMCACRCGIDVHLEDGPGGTPRVLRIEGNRDHPKNRGVLCAKGSAGLMQHRSPARLRRPLLRTGPRGSGEFREIGWDEAMRLAEDWLRNIRDRAPERLAFYTGRDQSQALTGAWAQAYGTPNYAAHGGFCSVNMAAAGIYTMGGAFWEFGAPDWERTKLFLLFGVAEDHDSNPIKLGLARLKERGVPIVAVNPVRTGYNAIADRWLGVTPGTDGALVQALIHELLKAGAVDLDYLLRYTNAPWLVIEAPGTEEDGLFLRGEDGTALVLDRRTGAPARHDDPEVRPDPGRRVDLADGRRAVPVFLALSERYLARDCTPEAAAAVCGVPAAEIRALARDLARTAFEDEVVIERPWTDWLGRRHDRMVGRPVAVHAMRGISAHANGFQTARAIHLLQILLGSVETPGGFRFKPPYPKPAEAHPRPHGRAAPGRPLDGPNLGYPQGPEDLLVDDAGAPLRLDKAFSWEAPLAAHGMMHMAIPNAAAGDPYPVEALFLYMANMAWNSSMNTAGAMEMLTATDANGDYVIPKIIYSDAYSSETVAFADLVLPDTTYLERFDCISLLDRPISEPDAMADAIRWPVVAPDRDVRPFQDVLIELGARLDLPGFRDADGQPYAGFADYAARHERRPGVGLLSGFRGAGDKTGRGAPNPAQVDAYIRNGALFEAPVPEEAAFFKPWNAAWWAFSVAHGLADAPQPYRFQLYLEPMRRFQLAAEGHGPRQPPDALRARIRAGFDPLPIWRPPAEGSDDYPLHALTQRPAAMYHSWGSQNAWLRQIHGENPLFVPEAAAEAAGLDDGDWAWVISDHARICVPVRRMAAVNPATVWTWNAIGKRAGAWALPPGAPEATRGFLMNHLIRDLLPPRADGMRWANADPVTGQAAWFDLRIRLEKADGPPPRPVPDTGQQRSPVGGTP